jgi:hypothetical protein
LRMASFSPGMASWRAPLEPGNRFAASAVLKRGKAGGAPGRPCPLWGHGARRLTSIARRCASVRRPEGPGLDPRRQTAPPSQAERMRIRGMGALWRVKKGRGGPRRGPPERCVRSLDRPRRALGVHACPGRAPHQVRGRGPLGCLEPQHPAALGWPSCRGPPRTCRGQAQVLHNRPNLGKPPSRPPLHSADLHTSRRRTRRSPTSS